MLRKTVLCVAMLTVGFGQTVFAQDTVDRRIDVSSGIALLNVRKQSPDDRVGGSPTGLFVSTGFFWTRHVVTQAEIVFQVDDFYLDYAREDILIPRPGGAYDLTTVSLQRHYDAGRGSVAQLVQLGTSRFRPYFGAGVGVEGQTIRHGRQEYTRPLLSGQAPPPDARTAGELPTELPEPTTTRHAVVFAQAGLKVSVTQRAHVLIDWKFARTGPPRFRLGLGVALF